MILNIDKSWTRLVALRARLTRRPQVANDRAPVGPTPKTVKPA
jgi:hypothetical protein